MKAITIEYLKREIPDNSKAEGLYKEIAKIGGFGDIGSEFKNGLPALDVGGLPEGKQKRIQELIAEAKTEAPADKPTDKLKKEGK